MTTYAINYYFGKLNPPGYHMVNLGFHIGSSYLIFLIVNSMSSGFFAALAAGLIFLVHPFNSEIVNYISTRSSVMASFFYLLSFYLWIRYRSYKQEVSFYLASLLAFAAGILSKEIAITLPAVLWLYDVYFVRKEGDNLFKQILNWRACVAYLPFILFVAGPYLIMRALWMSRSLSHSKRDLLTQLLTELPVIFQHWRMFIIPYPLTPIHYSETYSSFMSIPVILSLIFVLIYLGLTIFLFFNPSHKWRITSFFMVWFFIVILPTTIVPLGLIFQEHRGYLAGVSFVVILGLMIGEIKRFRLQKVATVLLIFLIGIYSAVTISRNKTWIDNLTLWSDTAEKSPGSSTALTGLGIAYKQNKMYKQAVDTLQKAINLGGQDISTARQNLAHIYIIQNSWNLAAKELELSIKDNPMDPQLYNDLGIAYSNTGKKDLAEKIFLRAAQIEPSHYLPYYNLGVFYMNEGRNEDAINVLEKVLLLSPEHMESRLRLGILLEKSGRKEDAANHYRKILKQGINKNHPIYQEAEKRLNKI